MFNNILDMNPNDNQGARCLAVNCYLTLKRPFYVLRIFETYPEDMLAETIYGKVLALFQLDRIKKAHNALKEAESALPLVAAEIAKKQHRKPKNLETKYITHGGKAEAYIYWIECAKHWKETPGAIEFVREYLPEEFDRVNSMFRRPRAYSRFKDLLDRKGLLDKWHKFEDERKRNALRQWCIENNIELED